MLSILMPVYNERATVEAALDDALSVTLPVPSEVVAVDDGSTDGSAELLARIAEGEPRLRVLTHARNAGKGSAVRTALGAARGDFAAILDADLEYDASDLGLLIGPLLAGEANAIFGVRELVGATGQARRFQLGNRIVTRATNVLFRASLHDVMTCHKMIRTDLFRELDLRARGFELEPEIAVRLLQRGESIAEVPIHYRPRSADAGKKLDVGDGLHVLALLMRCRLATT